MNDAADGDGAVQSNITAFWSTVAAEYEAHAGNVPAKNSAEFEAWVAAIARLLPPPAADVLDIACGTGFVSLIAAGFGHRVTGIDLSQQMLDEARAEAKRLALDVRFEQRDAVEPGLAGASFDAIICRHFLWTLREPGAALRNWYDLLRPGGRVVAIDGFWFRDPPPSGDADPDEHGLFERYYTRETRGALPAMSFTDATPMVELFRQAGFASVEVCDLADVHVLAEDPPSEEPWYVIVARRS